MYRPNLVCLGISDLHISRKPGYSKRIGAALVLALLAMMLNIGPSLGANRGGLSITSDLINFGNQPVNAPAQRTVTITNISAHTIEIGSAYLQGSSAFKLTGWTGQMALEPSQSFALSVAFQPAAARGYFGSLVLSYGGVHRRFALLEGRGVPHSTPASVSISPATASVQAGRSLQFTATVKGTTNTTVNWLVAGAMGGNSSVGTISSTGLYTAPSSVPTGPVTVTAQSAVASANQANATVTITPVPTPVSVAIAPGSASVQVGRSLQFTATVKGTTNTTVNWLVAGVMGGNSSAGTISSTGLYTAPSSAPTGPVTVTAQSAVASASSANATVTVSAATHSVLLSWTASSSAVVGYNIYRGTVSGGPYTKLNSSAEPATTYTDNTIQAGVHYFYATTAVDMDGVESGYSNEASAVAP
jgi:hypothetical protein